MTISFQLVRSSILVVMVLATMLGLAGNTDGQETIDNSMPLLWRLKTGDAFTVNLLQSSKATVTVDKRISKVNSNTRIRFDWKVTKAAEDQMTIEQSIAAIASEVIDPKVPEQAIAYDTDSDKKLDRKSRELLKQVKPLIGLKFEVTLSAEGKVLEVNIPKATQSEVDKLPNSLKLNALFSQRGLKELLGNSTTVFPESGTLDTWSYDDTLDSDFGKFVRTVECTVEKPIQATAKINTKTSIEPPDADVSKAKGIRLISLEGSGAIYFDRKRGHVTESKHQYLAQTEVPLREKVIKTVMEENIEMKISPKSN